MGLFSLYGIFVLISLPKSQFSSQGRLDRIGIVLLLVLTVFLNGFVFFSTRNKVASHF